MDPPDHTYIQRHDVERQVGEPISHIALKQQKITQSPLETGVFTFHVFKKPSFTIHKKLKGVSLLCKMKITVIRQSLKSVHDSSHKLKHTALF